ncbi:MAG: transglycosylase family protein [Solirubrobacteraceae bacterium]|nr:transglycosylase family protein [Solirubrobacteraceae bacterium]
MPNIESRPLAPSRARRLLTFCLIVCALFVVTDRTAFAASETDGVSAATVKAAQEKLGVEADGVIGPLTRDALRDFQRDEDLKVTGRLDARTRSALGLNARQASNSDSTGGGAAAGEAPSEPAGSSSIPASLRATLDKIAECESGGDPQAVSADGTYRGKYQFDRSTWRSMGGKGDPAAAPEREQDRRAAKLYKRAGSSPWPNCA